MSIHAIKGAESEIEEYVTVKLSRLGKPLKVKFKATFRRLPDDEFIDKMAYVHDTRPGETTVERAERISSEQAEYAKRIIDRTKETLSDVLVTCRDLPSSSDEPIIYDEEIRDILLNNMAYRDALFECWVGIQQEGAETAKAKN